MGEASRSSSRLQLAARERHAIRKRLADLRKQATSRERPTKDRDEVPSSARAIRSQTPFFSILLVEFGGNTDDASRVAPPGCHYDLAGPDLQT